MYNVTAILPDELQVPRLLRHLSKNLPEAEKLNISKRIQLILHKKVEYFSNLNRPNS